MRRLFSKSDLQTLGLLMALVVLSSTLPLSIGTIIISDHGQPEITENICQPLQMFNLVISTLLARPAPAVPEFVLCDMGSAVLEVTARSLDNREAPDTPPPKLV
jgi:hypothetical protein